VRGEPELARGAIRASRAISLASGTAIAAAGIAGVYLLGDRVESHYVWPFYLMLVCIPLMTLQHVEEGIARSFNWVNLALVPVYIVRVLLLLFFLAGAILLGAPATAATAMAAGIGATFVSFVAQYFMVNRGMGRALPAGPRTYKLTAWTIIALPLVIMDSSGLIQTHADLLVLNAFVTPDQLGIYYAAAKTISLIGLINFAVTAVANQKFAALNAREDHKALGLFIRQTTKWTFWPAVAAATGLLVLGKPLLWLFSPEFTVGYTVMMILAIGHVAKAYSGQAEMCLSMIGYHKHAAIILIATMTFNVALNFSLIPLWGVNGAATATAISFVVQSLALSIALKYLTGHQALLWVPGMGRAG
jgi:O-antigen/teichoic acid export membrane protein